MKLKLYIVILAVMYTIQSYAITLNSVLDSIASNNTSLKAKYAEMESKIAGIKASNNLGDTEIGFEYQKGDNVDGTKYGFSIVQGFDWPGMYLARSKANYSLINATQCEYNSQRLNILLSAKQLFLEIINSNRKIKAQTEIYNNIKQLSDEYAKAFNHGEISILDINKLKIELLNVKQSLNKSITERNALIEELTYLNGGKPVIGVENASSYPKDELQAIEVYENQLTTIDPEYNYNNAINKSSEKNISMAKMGWLPKFSVGYKYANELGDRFNGFSVGMALPIFSNRNKVSEAKASHSVSQFSKQDALGEKIALIKSDYKQVVYLREQIHSYNSVLTDSSNVEMLKKALNGGQITLLNYLMDDRSYR